MPFLTANGIKLYYETHGAGPALVLAHGRSGNHLSWWQQVPYFLARFRVVTFDHRGFGQSLDSAEHPGRHMFVNDLEALLDHLEIGSASIVGQSMGGWTALGYAVKHPQRVNAVVLADTTAGIVDARISRAYATKKAPPEDFVERALSPAYRDGDPPGTFLYREIGDLNPPLREPLSSLLASTDGPTSAGLRDLNVPTLFVVGAHDPVVSPEMARLCAELLPRATVEVFPTAGHSVYFECPDQFNDAVARFLSGPAPREPS